MKGIYCKLTCNIPRETEEGSGIGEGGIGGVKSRPNKPNDIDFY